MFTQINDNRVFIFENKINVTCNVFVNKLMKAKKGSRVFYETFVIVNDYIPQNKWQAEIGDITENEWKSYILSTKKWHEVKLRDFQYKINDNISVTNSFLAKLIKLIVEYVLTVRNNQKNIPFVFVMSKGQKFLRELREWLNTNVNIELSLEDRDILFSYTGINELVNYIYALAKLFIYQNKFISRTINIQGFISLLKKKKMLSEKYISFLNNNINKFFKKWSLVYNYFFPTVTKE